MSSDHPVRSLICCWKLYIIEQMSCHNNLLVLFLHKNYYRNHRGLVHRPERVDQGICPYDPSHTIQHSGLKSKCFNVRLLFTNMEDL